MATGISNYKSSLLYLLFFWLMIVDSQLQAQHYFTRTYTEADGLSSSMVYDITQDSTGMIWFATRSGISCYDGIRFINYDESNGLNAKSYGYLITDQKGKVWGLPQSGEPCVMTFQDNEWKPFTCDHALNIYTYYTAFDVFYYGDEINLAIGTDSSGVLIFHHGIWKQFTTSDGLLSNKINGVKGGANMIFVATENGLSTIRNDTVFNEFDLIPEIHGQNLLALEIQRDQVTAKEKVWLLGKNWAGYLEDHKITRIAQGFSLPTDLGGKRSFIFPERDKGVYFGNIYYIKYIASKSSQIQSIGRYSGLISEGGTAVFIDREKNTWITGFRGIAKIPSRRFSTFAYRDGLYDTEVASGVEISPGYYVFGHHGALTFLQNDKFTVLKFQSPLNKMEHETRVQDLESDSEGNIWAAVTALGLARIDRHRHVTWFGADKGIPGYVYSVVVTPRGEIFAASTEGTFQLLEGRFRRLPLQRSYYDGVRKLFSGPGEELYLATFNQGLVELRNGKEFMISSSDNPLARSCFAFFMDSKKRKWVGTAAGLYIVADTLLKKVDSGELAINRPVYIILEDHQGNLWFGTDNGAYRWNGAQLDQFTVKDGFSGLEVNRDAGFTDTNGKIWFGTSNGLTVFNPDFDYKPGEILPPIIHLSTVEAGSDILSLGIDQEVSATKNTLIFHFNIISYIDEDQVFYKCKLEGFDDNWSSEISSRDNQYRYINLQPGSYRFCLKARNALGIWSEPLCSGTIRIRLPFWFQWWFITLFLLAIAAIFSITFRVIIIRRYNLKLTKMVAIRTRDLRRSEKDLLESNQAKDNFFSIIAHDLKSPFNAILGMLELLTTEYSEFTDQERHKILMSLRTASTRTIDLLENLLTWAQAQKGLLPYEPEKFDMMELIRENVALFEPNAKTKRINLIVPLSENVIVYGDRNMIKTVIRNLISNAIKFTYPDGDVTIKINKENSRKVTVSVIDNGCGMTESALKNLFILDKRTTTKGTGNETGTGLGLILSKDFITKNGGQIWVESKPEEGTTFYFTLPVNPPVKKQ